MSFILDQLKKSGKKRALEMAMRKQAEKPAAIMPEPLLSATPDRKSANMQKWHVAVVAVLLGVAAFYGAVTFFRGPSLMRQSVVPLSKGRLHEAAPEPAMPSSGSPIRTPVVQAKEETVSASKSPEARQKQTETVKPVTPRDKGHKASEKTVSDRSAEESGKRSPGALRDVPAGIEPSDSVVADSVLEFKQLPQTVRKSLPEIRVTSHLYRKDSRLVSINGRIMSEGYNMDDGLLLEEITPEGVILSYGKHRFLVKASR